MDKLQTRPEAGLEGVVSHPSSPVGPGPHKTRQEVWDKPPFGGLGLPAAAVPGAERGLDPCKTLQLQGTSVPGSWPPPGTDA